MNEREELLSAEQAAELWERICGDVIDVICHAPSAWTIRELCRKGEMARIGVRVVRTGSRYWGISRDDLLTVMHEGLTTALARLEEEMGRVVAS